MDFLPKVSVIVPVYNAGEKLIPSIRSLLNQTLIKKDLEIIIVNDASTDDSGKVVDRLASDNSNIVPVHFSVNKGVHEARLAGLKLSTAPWIGFMDADDFARPMMFSTLLSAALDNDVDIVVCGSDRVTEQREIIGSKLRFQHSEKVEDKVFERFCRFDFGTGTLWNKLFRREVIEPWCDLHFPWRQSINEDLILNIGCFYNAKSIFLSNEVLYEYVLAQDSVTTTMKKCAAYVGTFRAYALAVTSYERLGADALSNIIDLYRIQLSWGSYQLESSDKLAPYKEDLEAAVTLLSEKNPYALSALSARSPQPMAGARSAPPSLYSLLKSKFKKLFI